MSNFENAILIENVDVSEEFLNTPLKVIYETLKTKNPFTIAIGKCRKIQELKQSEEDMEICSVVGLSNLFKFQYFLNSNNLRGRNETLLSQQGHHSKISCRFSLATSKAQSR